MAARRISPICLARNSILSSLPRARQGSPLHVRQLRSTAICAGYDQKANVGAKRDAAPKIVRGASKVFRDADEAVADIQNGATILSAGFGLCGTAETIIAALSKRGKSGLHSLTAVSNNAGTTAGGGLTPLVNSGQIDRLILSFLGANKGLESKYLGGEIAIELCPQGTIAERIRAGGAGIPAFFLHRLVLIRYCNLEKSR
ncbi:Succinyl-CoA:3-ketoacid coenzyme A transferase 1, mitochondrial [Lachnellula subtilissima]|uniref:Succinyl-CoA:3-ketoacid coenzyme A transferase 1, mitochondrial n=1 Tax=Lachnellula subtilissima TaxID=602034 RepID=A0A8H8REH5_9HELO|nr:Succinyl-CoA:3-ketoacid coenzyme A transferase 1, mitochondrial [Lachnellula subtilissima]